MDFYSYPRIATTTIVLSLFLSFPIPGKGQQNTGGQALSLTLSNKSDRALQVLRGGQPGVGNNAGNYGNFPNKTGKIRPGETITISSVKGRVWSFMLNKQLVTSYSTTSRANQSFVVRQTHLNAVSGNTGNNPTNTPAPNPQPGTVQLSLSNGTGAGVNLATQNQQGQFQVVGSLQPNQAASVSSVPGAQWLFLNQANQQIGNYSVTQASQQSFRIGAQNPTPAPGPGNNTRPNNNQTKGKGQGNGSKMSSAESRALVNMHNKYRNEGRIKNPKVSWSNKVARYAQGRADSIAAAKQYPPQHLPPRQNPYGENLAAGYQSQGTPDIASLASQWITKEQPIFKRLGSPRTYNRQIYAQTGQIGHYTQVIWKGTTEIGAGIASWQKGGFTYTVLVCCYSQKGNMLDGVIY